MHIYRVTDAEFGEYGAIVEDFDSKELLSCLDAGTPCPEEGTIYVPSDKALEALTVFHKLQANVYGGMPIQIGYCNGTNFTLNCLEYHRGCEVNVASKDFILLLARARDIRMGKLDTSLVKAFLVPQNVAVRVFETTLHYAPCGDLFRVIVVLPRGTNTEKPDLFPSAWEDRLLWAKNKWLLAHKESPEAKMGAYVGLVGANLNIQRD